MSNPSLINSNPSHQSTGFAIGSNIVLNFSEEVVSKEGTIEIRKTSDNSSFESFDVTTSTRIAGSGTSTITIDPEKTLEESTSYYLYIPNEAFDDLSGASFSERVDKSTFLFFTEDLTSPTFSSAATNTAGTKVILTYNETLSATTAATTAFAVTTGGVSNSITAATVSGSTVELTLTTAVKNDEAVTVTYTDPSGSDDANAIQDNEGNDVATLSSTSVTNTSTVVGTAPTFTSAATNTAGTKVILTYDEALSDTTAATSAFAVTTGGSTNSVTDAIVYGSTVELTLTTTVKNDETVTVSYTDPSGSDDANAIQDNEGNDVATLSSTSVTNNSTVAGTPPTLLSSSPVDDATSITTSSNIVLNFSEAVDVETGNIVIFKASDDSVVETIEVASLNEVSVTSLEYMDYSYNRLALLRNTFLPEISSSLGVTEDSKSNVEWFQELKNNWKMTIDGSDYLFVDSNEAADNETLNSNTSSWIYISTDEEYTPDSSLGSPAPRTAAKFTYFAPSTLVTGTGTNTITINPSSDLAEQTEYYVQIAATAFDDSSGNSYAGISDKTTFSFTTVDEISPTITGPFGSETGASTSSVSINENGTAVNTFTANETVTWSLNGGADAALFSINSSGALSFSSTPDYESPEDSDSGNDYVVNVRATDSSGNISDQTVTVTVANNQELDVSGHQVGTSYHLEYIKDYDGYLHANTGSVSYETKSAYKYQGLIDVNADGTKEAIYTNKKSGRWVTGSINSSTGEIDYEDHGSGGTTRVVGIYIDPLVTSGEVEQFGPHDSQRRFQNDLEIDNLIVKTSGDYDGDSFQEVYWKTSDGTAYLRALMHDDGNIQYANYQSEAEMSAYLTTNGYESTVSEIIS